MARTKKRGPGPSHVLITPDHAGNVVGVDPHKQTLTATVIDLNRPGFVGDSWSWRIKEGVHANGANSWEADHASVFA